MGSRKSIPLSSAILASRRLSSQLPDQRSGARVTNRPDEQLGPKKPSLSVFSPYMATRRAMASGSYIRPPLAPELVEALGVAVQDGRLVLLAQLVALRQLGDVVLAACVGHFVREVRGVDEGLVAHHLQREGHGQLLGLAADEHPAGFNLLDDVAVRPLVLAKPVLARRDVLEVRLVRGVEAFQAQQQPGHAAFEEGDAHAGESFEDAV